MNKMTRGARILHSLGRVLAGIALVGGVALPVGAASKNVDLDKNGSNESIVDLTVISSYPAKIRNKITNKAVGKTFTFRWPSAGPGGFTSSLGTGTAAGVGTIWDWQTGQTLYSYTGTVCDKDICFTPTNSSVGPLGPYSVPGRSLSRTDVTLSAASLTSSIISFFSPPQVLATATSEFIPGEGVFETITNNTPDPISIEVTSTTNCCDGDHQTLCDGECVSYLDDEFNCGACGIVCEGTKTCCNGECTDTDYDQRHCGACFQPSNHNESCCAGQSVDIFSDPANCGGCGSACPEGQSCGGGVCEEFGTDGVYGFSGGSPDSPTEGCPFGTIRCGDDCVDPARDPLHCGSCETACAAGEVCSASVCFAEATPCDQPTVKQEVPPGESVTICRSGRWFFAREVVGVLRACGDTIPDGEEEFCSEGQSASAGSFNRLEPVEGDPGPAFVTPYAVRVEDGTGDGLLSPGESGRLWITVLNVGSRPITGVTTMLISDPVQLVDEDGDGTPDGAPYSVLFPDNSASFPTLPGLGLDGVPDCSPVTLSPQASLDSFEVVLPPEHPGDVARPFVLRVMGTVDGQPWQQDVPFNIGITGRCDPAIDIGSYDGIWGLQTPMSRLVPEGDAPYYPPRPFKRGNVVPLKLYLKCGSYVLKSGDIVPTEIVGLTRVGSGPIDLSTIDINNDAGTTDHYFRNNPNSKQWHFNLRTSDLQPGTYVMKIRIAERKEYVAGFVLNR